MKAAHVYTSERKQNPYIFNETKTFKQNKELSKRNVQISWVVTSVISWAFLVLKGSKENVELQDTAYLSTLSLLFLL